MDTVPYSYRSDPAVPDFADDKPVIVFDGHCVMCSAGANYVLKRDRAKHFRLLAAQSPLGEAIYAHYGLKPADYSTNLLIEQGRVRVKSDGTLAMMAGLGFPWTLTGVFRIIPPQLRNAIYNVIARNRLKWFGRSDVCYMPSADDQDRFL